MSVSSKSNTQHAATTERRDKNLVPVNEDVYIIYSKWSLDEIESLLDEACEAVNLKPDVAYGALHVNYDREGYDTNQTFALMRPELFKELCDMGYDVFSRKGLKVAKWKVRDDLVLETKSLRVFLPKGLEITGSEVKESITKKLEVLFYFDVLNRDQVTVNVSLYDRETDTPRRLVYVNFTPETSDATISVVRSLLDNTYWDGHLDQDGNRYWFACGHVKKYHPSSKGKEENAPTDKKGKKAYYKHESKPQQ